MTPKLTPDAALHFAWAICSWILALNAVVFLLYYQLRLLFSFLYVGAADLRLVLFLAPVCVSIGFCCGFLSGGLYELPCVQLVLVWLIFSSLVFMVSVDAAICAQPSLASTSVSSVSVGVQVPFSLLRLLLVTFMRRVLAPWLRFHGKLRVFFLVSGSSPCNWWVVSLYVWHVPVIFSWLRLYFVGLQLSPHTSLWTNRL